MKNIYLLFLICLANIGFAQTKNEPVYFDNISNATKTIDIGVGLYPSTSQWNEKDSYTSFIFKVHNNSKSNKMDWDDYKVYILLKDGTIFYNYKTKAESGDYSCIYAIEPRKSHSQTICFGQKFDNENIDKIYVSFGDNQFFRLVYYDGKQKQ